MKKKTAVLAWAASMSDSDMLYITRFSSGDPFLYLRSGRKKTLVVTDFDLFLLEDVEDTGHELLAQFDHILLGRVELDHTTSRVKWFDDLILEVAGQDESAVVAELFDEPA